MERAIYVRTASQLDAKKVTGMTGQNVDYSLFTEENLKGITELILDSRMFREISPGGAQLLKQFTSLTNLYCNRTGLRSVAGFPTMPSVVCLELTDNHIHSDLHIIPDCFPNLRILELGGNHIKSFEELAPLRRLTYLEQLGLNMNPISEHSDYRVEVFARIPQLKALDNLGQDGYEYGEEEEGNNALSEFYEKEYGPEDDDNDGEFYPESGEEELDDIIDDEEEEDDYDELEDEMVDIEGNANTEAP